MTFHIVINCDNAAFGEDKQAELPMILTGQVLPALMAREETKILRDTNGNNVGSAYFTR
jgi:hypothetical protein